MGDRIKITYETLYELMRQEKNRDEIQQLDPSFYDDVLVYLREKQQYLDACLAKSDLFSVSEREKTGQQIQNAKRLLRELYERREKKIIDLALNKSRTNSGLINTAQLLAQEIELYERFVAVLNQGRDGVLVRVLALQNGTPSSSFSASSVSSPQVSSQVVQQSSFDSKLEQKSSKRVRFLEEVQQFVGEELEQYGPFSPNDLAAIPPNLADILISSGKAIEVGDD